VTRCGTASRGTVRIARPHATSSAAACNKLTSAVGSVVVSASAAVSATEEASAIVVALETGMRWELGAASAATGAVSVTVLLLGARIAPVRVRPPAQEVLDGVRARHDQLPLIVPPLQAAGETAALAMREAGAQPLAGSRAHRARWAAVAEQAEHRRFRASVRAAICGLPRNEAKQAVRHGHRASPQEVVVAASPMLAGTAVAVDLQAPAASAVVVVPEDLVAAAGLEDLAVAGGGVGERDKDHDPRRGPSFRAPPCGKPGARSSCASHGCGPE